MKSTEQNNVYMISNTINSFGFNEQEFCKLFTNEHRTLQQNFTRLCIEWIKTCASDDYRYDLRNEASAKLCKEIINSLIYKEELMYLPYI